MLITGYSAVLCILSFLFQEVKLLSGASGTGCPEALWVFRPSAETLSACGWSDFKGSSFPAIQHLTVIGHNKVIEPNTVWVCKGIDCSTIKRTIRWIEFVAQYCLEEGRDSAVYCVTSLRVANVMKLVVWFDSNKLYMRAGNISAVFVMGSKECWCFIINSFMDLWIYLRILFHLFMIKIFNHAPDT